MLSYYHYNLGSFLIASISFTTVHDQQCKCYTIKTISMLILSIQAYYKVNKRCFINIIITIKDRF